MYTRYFMFSMEHLEELKKLADKNGNPNATLGKVLVKGNYKVYTFLTRDPEAYSRRYADAKIVTYGDIRKIKYKEGS